MRKAKFEKSIYSMFLHTFFCAAAVLLIICLAAVAVFDPFFHYHKPIESLGLKAVLTQKEYQVPGTLEHFDYNAVLAGSSMVENNDNSWFDSAFNVKTVKAVRSYGGIADLCWYLDLAFENQDVDMVFFNLDAFAIIQEPETTFEASGCPMYLYDDNPINDVNYLFNKSVLLESIPYMIARSRSGYDENLSYSWAEGKDFSEEGALSQYHRKKDVAEMKPADTYSKETQGNIDLLVQEVTAHPDTEFYFFFPPYSALWWDDAIRRGEEDAYLYSEEMVISSLISCPNVKIFDYQDREEIVCGLGYYMDTIHFSPEVNRYIVTQMAAGSGLLTQETYRSVLTGTREMVQKSQERVIRRLEGQNLFQYE